MRTYRGDIVDFHAVDGTTREALVVEPYDDGKADIVVLHTGVDDPSNYHDAEGRLSMILRLDEGPGTGQWEARR